MKNAATESERDSWTTVLSSNDSKQIWNKINWKGSLTSTSNTEKPEIADLCSHFKSKNQSDDNSTLLCKVTGNSYVDELDHDVTVDEIKNAQKRLIVNKASSDGWTKRMLVNAPLVIMYAIQIIFNSMLNHHVCN